MGTSGNSMITVEQTVRMGAKLVVMWWDGDKTERNAVEWLQSIQLHLNVVMLPFVTLPSVICVTKISVTFV